MKPQRHRAASLVVLAAFFLCAGLASCKNGQDQLLPQYVGQQVCASCHKDEAERWSRSDHALAMQVADETTVLGDFNDATFTYDQVTSTFFRRDEKFFVRTDGPDGQLRDYEIAYTFGVYPLQQYLVPFPDGRLQALGVAWDSRAKEEGGQRWFHLYPGQRVTHDDPLHWTGRNQTWNYMCAECHSTNLRKNYDLASDRYATTWSEINVSCEACHGPGSRHVQWASTYKSESDIAEDPTKGLVVSLSSSGEWEFDDSTVARWKGTRRPPVELETCAPCHSRRSPITEIAEPGRPFLDAYRPAWLDNGLYHSDGQILDEVYEYGSFTQSKMYLEGVTCSDCHEPHNLKIRPAGTNAVCNKCHQPSKFDRTEHHHHKTGSAAAQCVNCHMPSKTYMVVDVRRDHSFRVPRPDHSVSYGTPNACTQCHIEKPARWAADVVARWYGPDRNSGPSFVSAIDAGRRGLVGAEKLLVAVASDRQKPPIVRATTVSLLTDYLSQASIAALQDGLRDGDPLVRTAVAQAIEALPPSDRFRLAGPLLGDPIRMVRVAAARALADTPQELMSPEQRADLDRAVAEYVAGERAASERPEAHLNVGAVYARIGRVQEAESALRTALRLDPRYVPALINLADLYRSQGRDQEGERLLRQATSIAPDSADSLHALGLLLVRRGQRQDAMELLGRAAALRPEVARYSYALAIALHSAGDVAGALSLLERTNWRHPTDREVLMALISINHERGNKQAAIRYAEKLVELQPADPEARATLEGLRQL
jgi:Tfp pilus assembly protein PilF